VTRPNRVPEVSRRPTALFLSRSWRNPASELSFVMRSLAGAASRSADVTVLVNSPAGSSQPDGAFDLLGTGQREDGGWPSIGNDWPSSRDYSAAVIDEGGPDAEGLLAGFTIDRVRWIDPSGTQLAPSTLQFTPNPDGSESAFLGLQVPVNLLASAHRHNGLGFTGYLLVLTDRSGGATADPPTEMVAWLTAAFPEANVVAVEEATATVWRGRALRGSVSVDTRMDLWRLLAHAHITIDLAPGRIFARECIESLRLGTPIVVPGQSTAAGHARPGGGVTFDDVSELIGCVDTTFDEPTRSTMATRGQTYADENYGDADRFMRDVAGVLFNAT
jgi:hypothetical protein